MSSSSTVRVQFEIVLLHCQSSLLSAVSQAEAIDPPTEDEEAVTLRPLAR